MRDSDREKIQFLVLSFLYLTYVAIQATDKHSDVKFFDKKKPSVRNCVGLVFQRGDKRVKYFIIHFNLMA